MVASKPVLKKTLIQTFHQLIADIRRISEGTSRQTLTDIDQKLPNHRVRICYSARPLVPENGDPAGPYDGGLKS
jgi:hypothetical protein